MLPDYFDEPEEKELPYCQTCGDECVVGYDDCIEVDEDEVYCSERCFVKAMMNDIGAKYI